MGVQGLWKLVEPIGRPVMLDTLDGKVLAVDVSLWLHQAVKGLRDRQGNPVPHAHLLVLFNRLCKLLFYGIKPVLVFDGGVPYLKQRTLASRRQRQAKAEGEVESAQDKLLVNFLQSKALETVTGITASVPNTKHHDRSDLFALPPMAEGVTASDEEEEKEEDVSVSMLPHLSRQGKSNFLLNGRIVDVQSSDFKSLPSETQHEVLVEMKRSFKENSWSHLDTMPQNAGDFSQFQLQNLLHRSQLSGRLKSVREDMAKQSAGIATTDLAGQPGVPSSLEGATIQASQLASDSSTHFVFIKHKLGLDKNEHLFNHNTSDDSNDEDGAHDGEKGKVSASTGARGVSSLLDERPSATHGEPTVNISSDSDDSVVRGAAVTGDIKSRSSQAAGGGFLVESDSDVSTGASSSPPIQGLGSRETGEGLTGRSSPREMVTNATPACLVRGDNNPIQERNSVTSEAQESAEVGRTSSVVPELVPGASSSSQGDLEIVVPLEKQDAHVDAGFSLFDASDFIPVTNAGSLADLEVSAKDCLVEPGDHGSQDDSTAKGSLAASPVTVSEDPVDLTLADSPQPPSSSEIDVHQHRLPSAGWEPSQLQMSSSDLHHHLADQQRAIRSHQQSQQRQIPGLSNQMVAETQNLLNLFGVPFIIAPMEAEAQCAWLEENGLVEGIITDDSDVWLFGAKTVYKNFFNQNRDAEAYTNTTLKTRMGLSREELIGVAMLCGSDYTVGLKGVGCVLAMEVLNDFRGGVLTGLEKFSTWWQTAVAKGPAVKEPSLHTRLRKLVVPSGFPDRRVYQAYTSPMVDQSLEPFEWASPDLVALRQFASDVFGWSSKRTDETLLPVIQRRNKQAERQTSVTQFFQTQPSASAARGIQSKRVKRVVLRMLDREKEGQEACAESGAAPGVKMAARAKRKRGAPCLSSSGSDSDDDSDNDEGSDSTANIASHKKKRSAGAVSQSLPSSQRLPAVRKTTSVKASNSRVSNAPSKRGGKK